jgi:hypothetical protein
MLALFVCTFIEKVPVKLLTIHTNLMHISDAQHEANNLTEPAHYTTGGIEENYMDTTCNALFTVNCSPKLH